MPANSVFRTMLDKAAVYDFAFDQNRLETLMVYDPESLDLFEQNEEEYANMDFEDSLDSYNEDDDGFDGPTYMGREEIPGAYWLEQPLWDQLIP